jgi:hypothetical protein
MLLWPCISLSQQADQLHAAESQSDKNAVVRLFYLPPYSYFHPPLLLRAVDNGDPHGLPDLLNQIVC